MRSLNISETKKNIYIFCQPQYKISQVKMEPKKFTQTLPAGGKIDLKSSITNLNVDAIIRAVSTLLQSQIYEDQQKGLTIDSKSELWFFSEEKYINEKPEDFDEQRRALLRETPTPDNIFEFMKALYECAQFSPECCIICLIYINRLIALTDMPLTPTNWRPLILCSLLVAQKVWDDKYLSSSDFSFIYPFFVTEEINKLEEKFLELVEYNTIVKAHLYAKYYFELRALYKGDAEEFPQPLDKESGEKLEEKSKKAGEKEQAKSKKFSNTMHQLPPAKKQGQEKI